MGPVYFEFCRLYPSSRQPPRQWLAPTCHLYTLNKHCIAGASLPIHMTGEVSWEPKRRRAWASYSIQSSGSTPGFSSIHLILSGWPVRSLTGRCTSRGRCRPCDRCSRRAGRWLVAALPPAPTQDLFLLLKSLQTNVRHGSCYITVDSALAASQNGFRSYMLSIHKKTKLCRSWKKN
jgi:hypothetical protein